MVSAHAGDFSYKPEKRKGKNFVEQKWGWSASQPGGLCGCGQPRSLGGGLLAAGVLWSWVADNLPASLLHRLLG